MANQESSNSPQVDLIQEWGQGFHQRDLSLLEKALHKDFHYITYPRSLGRPDRTKEEWLEQFGGVLKLWTAAPVSTIHSMIDTPGKVITHMTNKSQTSFGEMTRESICIAHIATDEDGSLKIIKIEEFTDSKTECEFYQAIAAARNQ